MSEIPKNQGLKRYWALARFFEFQPFGYSKQSAPTFWNTKTVSEVALMPAPALHLSDRQLKAVKAKDKDYALSECGRPIHENEY
ncbi:hypothetical protein [Pseudomonas sp. R4-34-07]|uniref:hypothetical protein n=1 Tax=Pseudomonas sp. R4-34-07 TaxID=658642 RepID=UPI0015B090F8|nr:hypothetical protein [Pseudomonas sp. R4-34-07]